MPLSAAKKQSNIRKTLFIANNFNKRIQQKLMQLLSPSMTISKYKKEGRGYNPRKYSLISGPQ